MKKLVIILFSLFSVITSFSQNRDTIRIECATRVKTYSIYEINGFSFGFPEYGEVMLLNKKYFKKGKQCFRRNIYFTQIQKIKNIPTGTIMKYGRSDCERIDTLYFPNIIMKLPIEINGAILNPDSYKNTLFILDESFPKLVNKCNTSNYKHWEFNSRVRQPYSIWSK